MKTKALIIALGTTIFIGCASPEQRSEGQMDTTTITSADTAGTDTTTNVNGRSGDNGTGTDTTNTAEQNALKGNGG